MDTFAFHISRGNPGAMLVVAEAARIAPINVFALMAWKVRGSDLWVKYKECGKDITKLLALANEEIQREALKEDAVSAEASPK